VAEEKQNASSEPERDGTASYIRTFLELQVYVGYGLIASRKGSSIIICGNICDLIEIPSKPLYFNF
jgi:hypothetical protein